jgi:hypothetical protein
MVAGKAAAAESRKANRRGIGRPSCRYRAHDKIFVTIGYVYLTRGTPVFILRTDLSRRFEPMIGER